MPVVLLASTRASTPYPSLRHHDSLFAKDGVKNPVSTIVCLLLCLQCLWRVRGPQCHVTARDRHPAVCRRHRHGRTHLCCPQLRSKWPTHQYLLLASTLIAALAGCCQVEPKKCLAHCGLCDVEVPCEQHSRYDLALSRTRRPARHSTIVAAQHAIQHDMH